MDLGSGVANPRDRRATISIAMATYNGERFIGEQLRSLAAQTRRPDELVVSDDGSTDRTLAIVDEFARTAPFPVRVRRNDVQLGYGDNFLAAARACTGEWIAFCDQDDVWLPHKLDTVARYFHVPDRDVLLVVHNALVVDAALQPTGVRYPGIRRRAVRRGTDLPMLWFAGGLTMVFRADLVTRLSPHDRGPGHGSPAQALAHDAWVCWLACLLGDVALLTDDLVLYRRHAGTTTHKFTGSAQQIQASRGGVAAIRRTLRERDAATYARMAAALRMHATAFGRLAQTPVAGAWRERLQAAERRYRTHADWLAERSASSGERGVRQRLGHLRRAIATGGYRSFYGAHPWRGARAFAKDLAAAVVGNRRLVRFVGAANARDIVLLSTADWDNPFWTNKQHVAAELARRGFRVLYVESLGLRRPTLQSRDLTRMLRRLWRAVRVPRRVRDHLWVWSPLIVPAHGRPWVRRVNRAMFRAGLAVWLRWLGLRRDVLWTYNPMTTEVLALSGFRTVVYHCVDEIKAAPGMPRAIIETAERELVRRADVIFATAPKLADERRGLNRNTHYLSNVADFDHFAQARDPATAVPEDLARLPEPRIGFVGAISAYKLDFELLRQLARRHPEWSIVLIGAVGEGDPATDVAALRDLPNVHLLGPRPYAQLPAYLRGLRVGILPSAMNDYTASMFPMKFFEYLAAGLPVVSVDLPALREHADVATLAATPTAFIAAVEAAVHGAGPPLARRIERAQGYTYAGRTDAMLEILRRGAGD